MFDVKKMTGYGVGIVVVIVALILIVGGVGKNDADRWQVKQDVSGSLSIRDKPGYYAKMFASIWTWPRAMQFEYRDIRVTFNDGGTADVDGTVRIQLPVLADERLRLHREFSANPENVKAAVVAHITNVIKATGPTMSSSEHQSARKAEFQQLVFEQTQVGIYKMRRIEKEIIEEDLTADLVVMAQAEQVEGAPPLPPPSKKVRTVLATEIITDNDGMPVVGQESPIDTYGIKVVQLSVGRVEYDSKTRELFESKKESFLNAEQAKADRQQEYEQTLMIVQQGLRRLAEAEADANVEKELAVIAAEKQAEVAEQQQIEQQTIAETKRSVAEIALEEAKLRKLTAEQDAEAVKIHAAAEEERIEKAGALTEEKRVLAEIEMRRDIEVAKYLAGVRVPSIVMSGNDSTDSGSESTMKDNLMNLYLMKQMDILGNPKDPVIPTMNN